MVSIDEDARRRFEADWLSGKSSSIKEYLPQTTDQDTYLGTLEELVCIDLEFRWQPSQDAEASAERTVSVDQAAVPTRVEDYLREFPELDEPTIVRRLIEQEVLVRLRSGYIVEPSELKGRFPEIEIDDSIFESVEPNRSQQSSDAKHDLEQLPQEFGPYVLLELMGRGGMGSVYRAKQGAAKREVAIKIAELGAYNAATRQLISDRFQQEARAAASLAHDHSVPVYDVGEINGHPYYCMRLVEGGDLGARSKGEPLEPRVAAHYLLGITRCMQLAHSRGLLHRDIKPANILVDGVTDRAMLTDFGLARFVEDDSGMTQTGQVLGTPSYMPPEQIRDSRSIDARADVYSLGGSLYQLLTGRPPFKAADLQETLRQVLNQEPAAPRSLNASLDRDLDTICLKCLEKEPRSRYQSAGALADDLEHYLQNKPISARPVGPVKRLTKWSRRNRGLSIAIGAAVLGLLAALAASLIGLVAVQKQNAINVATQNEAVRALNEQNAIWDSEPLLESPGLAPFLRRLQRKSLDSTRRLAELFAENPAAKTELAHAHAEIGTLQYKLGLDRADTKRHFEAALKTMDELPDEIQRSAKVLAARSDALVGLALLARQAEDVDLALRRMREARSTRNRWIEIFPNEVEAVRKLANAQMNEGLLLGLQGKLKEAQKLQAEAQQLRELLDVDPAVHPRVFRDMAQAEFNLAFMALRQGDVVGLIERLETAHDMFEKLLELNPIDASLWEQFAQVRLSLADFVGESASEADRQRANLLVIEALRDIQALLETHPGQPEYARRLLGHYQTGLDVLISQNQLDTAEDALAEFQRAWEIVLSELAEADRANDPETQMLRLHFAKHRALLSLGLDAAINPQAALEILEETLQVFEEQLDLVQTDPLLADVARFLRTQQSQLHQTVEAADETAER